MSRGSGSYMDISILTKELYKISAELAVGDTPRADVAEMVQKLAEAVERDEMDEFKFSL
jgi:hypothetical protein